MDLLVKIRQAIQEGRLLDFYQSHNLANGLEKEISAHFQSN
jgi:hypothetical protein